MRARKAKAKALAEGKSELPAQGLEEEEKAELGTKRKLYETKEEIDGMLDSENGLFCGMEVMNMSEYQVSGGEPVTVTLKEPKDKEEPKKKKKKKATPRATAPTAEREKEISSEDASEISESWSLHCGVSLHPVLCRGLASLKYPLRLQQMMHDRIEEERKCVEATCDYNSHISHSCRATETRPTMA